MPDSILGGAEEHPHGAVWSFDFGSGVVPWVGSAPPDVRMLHSVRRIRSRSGAGHVPTWAYSTTMGAHVQLESGLEHDLLRDLDRDPRIIVLVAQPARLDLRRRERERRGAVPDLLSLSTGGDVTLWSVRPEARQDERFLEQVEMTSAACASFGWSHRTFSGVGAVRRANLMWLDGYRTEMPWYPQALTALRSGCGARLTLSDVLAADRGVGHVVSATWYALRHGTLECDLDRPFSETTELRFIAEVAA